jgi:hypothetical protein
MHRALILAVVALAAACAAPAVGAASFVHFQSPSGNLDCIGSSSPAFVQCLAEHATWPSERARPAGCNLDWSPYELTLERRAVRIGSCRGDVGPLCLEDCRTLGFGQSVNIGPIRCRSAANGITCRYVRGKLAGFRIARTGSTVWRA